MYQTNNLGYAEAQRAIQAMVAEITRRGKTAVVAVVDAHGEMIALVRMDGAPLPSIIIASNKAYTAARAKKPTREIGQRVKSPEFAYDIAYHGDPRFVVWGGGVPVLTNGEVVGAVAVSGLPEEEDMQVAAIGALAATG